jgi:preprotein translocase subunit YajC
MSGTGFLVIVVAFAFLYFVLIRPQKRRQIRSQEMLRALEVGDEVVTAGGIYGRITALRDEDVNLEIAPDLEVRVARRAIGGVVTAAGEAESDVPPEGGAESPPAGGDGYPVS